MPAQSSTTLLPIERELLIQERRHALEKLQWIEKQLNMPSSLLGRELRRAMHRAAERAPDDGNPHR